MHPYNDYLLAKDYIIFTSKIPVKSVSTLTRNAGYDADCTVRDSRVVRGVLH